MQLKIISKAKKKGPKKNKEEEAKKLAFFKQYLSPPVLRASEAKRA